MRETFLSLLAKAIGYSITVFIGIYRSVSGATPAAIIYMWYSRRNSHLVKISTNESNNGGTLKSTKNGMSIRSWSFVYIYFGCRWHLHVVYRVYFLTSLTDLTIQLALDSFFLHSIRRLLICEKNSPWLLSWQVGDIWKQVQCWETSF